MRVLLHGGIDSTNRIGDWQALMALKKRECYLRMFTNIPKSVTKILVLPFAREKGEGMELLIQDMTAARNSSGFKGEVRLVVEVKLAELNNFVGTDFNNLGIIIPDGLPGLLMNSMNEFPFFPDLMKRIEYLAVEGNSAQCLGVGYLPLNREISRLEKGLSILPLIVFPNYNNNLRPHIDRIYKFEVARTWPIIGIENETSLKIDIKSDLESFELKNNLKSSLLGESGTNSIESSAESIGVQTEKSGIGSVEVFTITNARVSSTKI